MSGERVHDCRWNVVCTASQRSGRSQNLSGWLGGSIQIGIQVEKTGEAVCEKKVRLLARDGCKVKRVLGCNKQNGVT